MPLLRWHLSNKKFDDDDALKSGSEQRNKNKDVFMKLCFAPRWVADVDKWREGCFSLSDRSDMFSRNCEVEYQ